MKSLNLRMDDEQHAQLEQWARESRRSMNAEVLHRLFDAEGTPDAARSPGMASGGGGSPSADDHFKPDPKPIKAEKKGRR